MYNQNNQINDKGGRRHEATVNIKTQILLYTELQPEIDFN